MVGIYKITSPSGKIYIGQSRDIRDRINRYNYLGCHKQVKLYASLKKYSFKEHKFQVIHELPLDIDQEILNNYEILYLNSYKELGFNMLNIKDGGSNGKHSEETKKKISLVLKGKIRSRDQVLNIRVGRWRDDRIIQIFDKNSNLMAECLTQKDAEKLTGVSRSAISNNLAGQSKSCRSHIFKYKIINNV